MSEGKAASDGNLHANHRKRLRERFRRDGFDSFEEHNILELLLFHSIPRADTNPLAHRLINRFGSLYGVLCASEAELLQVDGVGPATAHMIRSVFDGARTANLRRLAEKPVATYDRLCRIATEWMAGRADGTAAMILLDDAKKLLDICPLASEHRITPVSYPQTIAELCGKYNCRNVVLMHNHPDDNLHSSAADRLLTAEIYHALKEQDIRLSEHLIVHEFDARPILDESIGQAVSAFPQNYL